MHVSSRIPDHQHDCETRHHTIKTSLRRVLATPCSVFAWGGTAALLPQTAAPSQAGPDAGAQGRRLSPGPTALRQLSSPDP